MARQRLAISSSLGAIICKQPLLEVGDTLENIPLITEGTMSGGIMLADPINIHITNGGLFRIEICGNCVAPRPPVPGICPEGLIRVERLLILFVGLLLAVIVIQVFHASRIIEWRVTKLFP